METTMDLTKVSNKRELKINKWQEKFNLFLGIYTVLFLAEKSLPGHFFEAWIGRFEILTGLVMLGMIVWKFAIIDSNSRKKWLKSSILVFIYLVVRCITFVKLGFDYSTARTVFFEFIYLLCLSEFTIDTKFFKSFIIKFTLIWTLIFNILNAIFYNWLNATGYGTRIEAFLYKYSYLQYSPYRSAGTMYVNPNTFGLLTGLCMIFAYVWYKESNHRLKKPIFIAYEIFAAYCLYISWCRSAVFGIFAVVVIMLLNQLFKKFNHKKETMAILLLILIATGGLIGYINYNKSDNLYNFTYDEMDINAASSGRYFIWKSAMNSEKGNLVLGCGSLRNELEIRNDYQKEEYNRKAAIRRANGEKKVGTYKKTELGPHNGYLSMILCSGYVGAILFFLILIGRIGKSKALNNGVWYLAIIYFLIANIFESLFLMNRFFICLFMFIILALDEEETA